MRQGKSSLQSNHILRKFDLNLLRVFEALVTECHVTRAARKLCLSQPAVSHALSRMRDELDDALLVKTGRGMQATPRALEMLPQVQQILKLLESALAPVVPFEPVSSARKFVIAITDYFELVYYPLLLERVINLMPAVQFEIRLITEKVLNAGLVSREVDLVIGLEAIHEIPKGLVQKTLYREELVCLVPRNKRDLNDDISLQSYLEQSHVISIDLAGPRPNAVDLWLAQQGLGRNIVSSNLSYTAAARIVTVSDVMITLPRGMADFFTEIFPLRMIHSPPGLADVEITMIHHPLYARSPGIGWLMKQVEQIFD